MAGSEDHSDRRILEAWAANVEPWTEAVRAGRMPSRCRITDAAILETLFATSPGDLLDVGCGEGWLVRAVADRGVRALGVDAVAGLIERGRAGGGRFEVMSYEALAAEPLAERFDTLVCNFSLLGDAATSGLIEAAPRLLQPGGRLLVQTLHPVVACGDAPYRDGWRDGSWDGIDAVFARPAPWYFRTLASWLGLSSAASLRLLDLREPVDPATGRPASVIFVAAAI